MKRLEEIFSMATNHLQWLDSTIGLWYLKSYLIFFRDPNDYYYYYHHSYLCLLLRQIYLHGGFDVLNIAKVKYYAEVSQEYLCSANEVLADENFQR